MAYGNGGVLVDLITVWLELWLGSARCRTVPVYTMSGLFRKGGVAAGGQIYVERLGEVVIGRQVLHSQCVGCS
jgi:hypothetical protein